MSSEIYTLPELVDLALRTPEYGIVNFNILRVLLHKILSECRLQNVTTEWKATKSSTKVSELYQKKKEKFEKLPDYLYLMRVPVEKESLVIKKETEVQASIASEEKNIQTCKERERRDATAVKELVEAPTEIDKSEDIFKKESKLNDASKIIEKQEKSETSKETLLSSETDEEIETKYILGETLSLSEETPIKSEVSKEVLSEETFETLSKGALLPHKSFDVISKDSSIIRKSFLLEKKLEESQKKAYSSKEAVFGRKISAKIREDSKPTKAPLLSEEKLEETTMDNISIKGAVLLDKPSKEISLSDKPSEEIPTESTLDKELIFSKESSKKISKKLSKEQLISKESYEEIPIESELNKEQMSSKGTTEEVPDTTQLTKNTENLKETSILPSIKHLILESKMPLLWEIKKLSKRIEALEGELQSVTYTVGDLAEWKQSKIKRLQQVDGEWPESDYSGPTVNREEFEDTIEELGEAIGLLRITQKELKDDSLQQCRDILNEMLLRPTQEEINKSSDEIDKKFSTLSKAIKSIEKTIKDVIFPETCGISKCISCKRKAHLPFSGKTIHYIKEMSEESSKRNLRNVIVKKHPKPSDDLKFTKVCLKRIIEDDNKHKINGEIFCRSLKPHEKDELSQKAVYIEHLTFDVSDLTTDFPPLRKFQDIMRQDCIHLPSIQPKNAPITTIPVGTLGRNTFIQKYSNS